METIGNYPKEKTLHALFEEQVKRTPGNTATIFKNQTLNYLELNQKANSIARLLRDKGVGADQIVPVIVERSLAMAIGLMAVLKAGGAYLPIAPETPANRLNLIQQDTGATVILSQSRFINKLKSSFNREVELIDLEAEEHYQGNQEDLPHLSKPHNLAYVIYTSGSTGKPKGVMIQHLSIVNRLHWMQQQYPLTEKDIILQKTPFFFDVSVWELFWWSLVGASVCFLQPGFEKFPQAIIETVETKKITVMHFVPSMMAAFLGYIENSGELARLATLKRIFASGEALKPTHVQLFNRTLFKTNQTHLTNLYGPTEATVDVSYFDLSTEDTFTGQSIPIGKAINNIQLLIMNEEMQQQPDGNEGELCIGGVGLARGYVNKPDLTAEKFVINGITSDTLYRTGDLARSLPDGNIEFLGRLDFQVKIRGLRIELGEIESVLASHPDIRDCAVIVKETSETIVTIEAFIVVRKEISPIELKKYLNSFLPEYMIPGSFIIKESLPLTPSGKVDRNKLKS